ncbi:MAG: hypothetical protein R3A52_15610 [Polyangiales bacterium]
MPALRALASLWRARVGLALSLLLGLACWSNTLTDHLGFGASLVTALFASVLASVVGAGLPVALRARGEIATASQVTLASVGYALAVTALPLLTALAHALVAPACDPGQGAVAALLVALPGPPLAALLGVLLGAAFTRERVATTLAALLVPAFIAWSVVRFYRSPAVFAYDPFFGFWPGALYDENVPLGLTQVTHRAGTLGWFVALAALLQLAWRTDATLSLRGARSVAAWTVAVAGACVGLGIYVAGPALGHRLDAGDVAERLGGEAWSRRCVVRFDRSIAIDDARLAARDCDVRVAQLEDFYGVRGPRRVTVFLFANAEQKRALMGAADTYIAKPWRAEVYLQWAPFPHPVLKHELAHVVAGAMSSGFLRIPTRGALLPLPGLIEGAAVAAAWEGEGDLTPHQWSRAMLEAGLAPRVRALTGLGFLASASVTAYTAAGSFCRWLHDTRGAERFRRVYDTGDFEGAYGEPLSSLESRWHAFLREVPLPDRALARARTRFRRASVFGRSCPLTLDALSDQAARLAASGDLTAARSAWARFTALDPTDLRARVEVARIDVRAGDLSAADRAADEAARVLGPAAGARVRASVADAAWRWRSPRDAAARYAALDETFASDDELRSLDIKRRALALGGAFLDATQDLLIGRRDDDPSLTASVPRLATLAPSDPVAAYLLARQLSNAGRFAQALHALDLDALARANAPRVFGEARRVAAVARYRVGDLDGAEALFRAVADDPERPRGARDLALDWVDRIRRERR